MSNPILSGFNDHFMEFVADVLNVFPDNKELQVANNAFGLIRKANPKMIIKIWKEYVVDKYGEQISRGDISFFVNKDYSRDLENVDNSSTIMQSINQLRAPVQMMSAENQQKTMKYIQNLKQLCEMYYN
jgi:hypothetical protein